MIKNGVIKTSCRMCTWGCGVLVTIRGGKAIKIEGDPDSLTRGAICEKGLASLEYLYHHARLKYPLKRAGKKGENRWQRITWEEALNTISEQLAEAKNSYGAESAVFVNGGAKGYRDSWISRFANVFGSPNYSNPAQVCFVPSLLPERITYGFMRRADLSYPPRLVINWGFNSFETNAPIHRQLVEAIGKGTKILVIDPKKINLCEHADLWLRVRPGSDLALAMGMINVIINEGLYDKDFVEKWTNGLDELKVHIEDYPPEKVEKITWVDSEKIREAARAYAENKPSCIITGNAIDFGENSFQAGRAISILRAITGNLEIPGGELRPIPLPIVIRRAPDLTLSDKMTQDQLDKRLGADLKLLPVPPVANQAMWQNIVRGIMGEEAYTVQVLYLLGANILVTWPNSQRVYEALMRLNFLVVADNFMTPTAELADIVLPVTSDLEFDQIWTSEDFADIQVQQQVAERVGECRTDYEIFSGLAKRAGLGEYFWDNEKDILDYILKPAGLSFDEFRKIGFISSRKSYRTYEKDGFQTASKKVQLYFDKLKLWGFDPLPNYHEPSETPYSEPELAKEYPLIFTSSKKGAYRHSGLRQISSLRGTSAQPTIEINPETAKEVELNEGDWAYIETKRGRIKQQVRLNPDIDPRVVYVDYAWWFPERGESNLFGWDESNMNILTEDKPPYSREMGSFNLTGICCKIYKVQ